jgi:hypothetical protein
MKTMRIAIVAAALASPAIGLASLASAELTDGTYKFGQSDHPWVITSCGAGCKHAEQPGTNFPPQDYHLSGNTWSCDDGKVVETIDNSTLVVALPGPRGGALTAQLVKVS